MKFCEDEQKVDYVIAMATNNQLKLRALDTIEKAKKDYEQRLEPVVELRESLLAPNEELEEVPSLVPNSTWWELSVLPNRKVMELSKESSN
jgi:hypothetical protein